MSCEEKDKWNRTYREGATRPHFEGARSPVVDWAEALLPRKADILDVGCGTLRNSRELAARGHRILALDVAEEAFRSSQPLPEGLQGVVMDLDHWQPPEDTFDLVLVVHYLNRPLLAALCRSLNPGGLLALEIRLAPDGDPENPPAFRLAPGEIETLVAGLCLQRTETLDGEVPVIRALFQRPLSTDNE